MVGGVTRSLAGFVLKDLIGSILGFPIWWYTKGFVVFGRSYLHTVQSLQRQFGVGIWIRNIFVPMYGSYDFAGRVVSFAMRVVQIIVRGFVFVISFVFVTAGFLIWMLLPALALAALVSQIVGFGMYA